eukprot:1160410-Pelagomonas_calceolata.AAC.2
MMMTRVGCAHLCLPLQPRGWAWRPGERSLQTPGWRPQVGSHDDDGVLEGHCVALRVSGAAVIQDLEQHLQGGKGSSVCDVCEKGGVLEGHCVALCLRSGRRPKSACDEVKVSACVTCEKGGVLEGHCMALHVCGAAASRKWSSTCKDLQARE